ncbi:hypothetical protein PHYPSEUDO_005127 [Phytophthora pseudosyringae]|uniref:Uncharacterized protein n=1 Tax=Phytophthora pseudosyringae TaxID=221518 RepID=A0A8T1VPV2_9STRA|nr:hypothetical protein PHYPSEUDO_005127 [Phytophthora pseudosyringae]
MELGRKLALMLAAAVFLCAGNLCIIGSKVDGRVPYSSVTATFLIEALKLAATLTAIVVTRTAAPDRLQLRSSGLYAVPALLSALESNLNYVVLRYLDAATLSVLWNLKILLTAALFRYALQRPLSELQRVAIALLLLGVLTSQSDRFRRAGSDADSEDAALGVALALVGVALSSCASVFAEWALKRQARCPFLWQSAQLYGFGVMFNALGVVLVDSEVLLLSDGFFRGYNGWTLVVVVVNAIGGVFMACILKYLDNIACVYSHSMAMMLTTLLSMVLFAFSPSLEFACGLGVLVLSMYLYHHPLAQEVETEEKEAPAASDTSTESESDRSVASSLQRKTLSEYKEVPRDSREEEDERLETSRISILEA